MPNVSWLSILNFGFVGNVRVAAWFRCYSTRYVNCAKLFRIFFKGMQGTDRRKSTESATVISHAQTLLKSNSSVEKNVL